MDIGEKELHRNTCDSLDHCPFETETEREREDFELSCQSHRTELPVRPSSNHYQYLSCCWDPETITGCLSCSHGHAGYPGYSLVIKSAVGSIYPYYIYIHIHMYIVNSFCYCYYHFNNHFYYAHVRIYTYIIYMHDWDLRGVSPADKQPQSPFGNPDI